MPDKNSSADGESLLLKVKSDALRLLAVRPRIVEELKGRLKLKKYPDSAITPVLETLGRQGLLDDEKFAKLFAHSQIYSRPVGRRQLEIDLKKKGLSAERISRTLEGLKDYDEKAAAKELIRPRFLKMSGISNEKKKARLFGFLKRRGFQTDVIFSALSELLKESLDDDNG